MGRRRVPWVAKDLPGNYLRERVLSGIRWNAVGQGGRQLVAFLLSVVLARLLSPREFGLVAMLLIFQEMANALVNAGLTAPLIREDTVSDRDCSTVFWVNVGVAVACYLSLVAAAPGIAALYDEPALESLVKWYSLVFVLHSLANVHIGLLLRRLEYKAVNVISVAGVLVSSAVAVALAAMGFGVYSLIGQQISYAAVSVGLAWRLAAWRPVFVFDRSSFRRLFGLGSAVLCVSLLDKIISTIDNLIIGKLEGTVFVGLYSRGKSTRDLPMQEVTALLASLLLPFYSRVETVGDLRYFHKRLLGLVAFVSAPVMVGLAIVAEPLIVVIYSAKWLPAAEYLRLFCLFGLTIPLNSALVQTVMARAQPGVLLRSELLKKLALLLAMAVGALLGPVGFVLMLGVGWYVAVGISARVVARLLGMSTRDLLRPLLPGALAALAMGVPAFAVVRLPWANPLAALLAASATGVLTYVGIAAALRLPDFRLTVQLVQRLVLPGREPAVTLS